MKIAIDFDDVVVQTVERFLVEWNSTGVMPDVEIEDITHFGMAKILDVYDTVVADAFARLDFDYLVANPGVVPTLNNLLVKGHELCILTHNPRYRDVRDYMNDLGFSNIPVFTGVGHKAGWCRDNEWKVLIDDSAATLKGARTVGVHAIRFLRPWNEKMESVKTMHWGDARFEYTVGSWADIEKVITDIDFALTPLPYLLGQKVIVKPYEDEEIITNARGAKQAKIEGRYDLIPMLALKEIAKVFESGAKKYGEGNWEKLSIDEVLNHVHAHLLEYHLSPNREDLSHAACRIMMALELFIEQEPGNGP